VLHPADERQKVVLEVFATDAILGTEPARLPVLQVGEHSSLSSG